MNLTKSDLQTGSACRVSNLRDLSSIDACYRVHCRNIGWMRWAKNGEPAGTAGNSCRLEIMKVMKGLTKVDCQNCGASKLDAGISSARAMVAALLIVLILALTGCASPISGLSSSSSQESGLSSPEPISNSPELNSGAGYEERDEWLGHVRGSGNDAVVVDFSGIEGEYCDGRDGGRTDTHGFYTYCYIGPLTISDDGKSGTGTLDIRWIPQTGKDVANGVAEFECDIVVSFSPANEGQLSCAVNSKRGDLRSDATIAKKKDGAIEFVWGGGMMHPTYAKEVEEDYEILNAHLQKAEASNVKPTVSTLESVSATSLDIDERDNRTLANEFLCWLSLCMPQRSLHTDIADISADVDIQVAFCVWYLGITQDAALESGDYGPAASTGGGSGLRVNARVSEQAIRRVAREFFGTSPDLGALGANTPYTYKDGYVYFTTTAPFGQTAYWSVVTSITQIGEDEYRLSFDVYNDGMPYTPQSDSYYAMSSTGVAAERGADTRCGSGEAVVVVIGEGGSKALHLKSYKRDISGGEGDTANTSPTVITTPYYTITIPAWWPKGHQGKISYTVDEELKDVAGLPESGIGCTTEVSVDGELFCVTCFTTDWHVQGDMVSERVGYPGNLPGWHVIAYIQTKSNEQDAAASGEYSRALSEFVSFITLAS